MFSRRHSICILVLFAFSGVSGLIYQSVWSHYLGLTLGHAAYAQTMVLAIFMAAMALGAWIASRKSERWKNPMAAYAIIEAVIGVLGILFHSIFIQYSSISQDSILPTLTENSAQIYQWVTAGLLIFPQCVLLGMTFPLLSASLLRANSQADGKTLGGLYFSNSFGAAMGALLATFLFLPKVGMPGAMTIAGLLNIIVACGAWMISRKHALDATQPKGDGVKTANLLEASPDARFGLLICFAAGITGATSFVYEIVWVRLLNQALGTTLHSFELMLASFIFGLAFGGLWISKRSTTIGDPVRYAGIAQIGMALAAFSSLIIFANSFVWVGWLQNHLSHNANGYTLFNLGSALIALLVMFPTAFFAGMTLPLFTMSLLRKRHGERSIGIIYAANTAGAILGVLFTVHALVPLIGINLSLVLAALLDLMLGLVLLRFIWEGPAGRVPAICGALGLAALIVTLRFGMPDPVAQVSGVYRTGEILDSKNVRVAYFKDGKTSTIGVIHYPAYTAATISTNGKPDATMALSLKQEATSDEVTMVMLAALPLASHPNPKTAGIIGWGSGLSTHTLLGTDQIDRVDNVEIEPAIHEGAKLFGERVSRAYTDPRSQLIIEDARTYFATGAKKYDIIISEPSNPWVSGVASLFTDQFYQFLGKHLEDQGILAQWVHSYELSDKLLAKIIASLQKTFPHVELYFTNDLDLILLASKSPIAPPHYARLQSGILQQELTRVDLGNQSSFQFRHIGSEKLLSDYVRIMGATGNSDYYPVLALEAPRSRFVGDRATFLHHLVTNGLPVLDLLDVRKPVGCSAENMHVANTNITIFQSSHLLGCAVSATFNSNSPTLASIENVLPAQIKLIEVALEYSRNSINDQQLSEWSRGIAELATMTVGILPQQDLTHVWIEPKWISANQSPLVLDIMQTYRATAMRDPANMKLYALKVLATKNNQLDNSLREQMLAIAMLGAAAQKEYQAVHEIDKQYAGTIIATEDMTIVRTYLLAQSH